MTRYLTRVHTYYCDDVTDGVECNASSEWQGTAREAWAEARNDGWTTEVGGRHYCPKHGRELAVADRRP